MKKALPVAVLAVILMIFAIAACSDVNSDTENTTPINTDGTVVITDGNTATSITSASSEASQTLEVTTISTPSGTIDQNNTIVQTAEALIGIEFVENGDSPVEGFDNSGFIYYVLRENGFINCPRLGRDQANMGTNVDYADLTSGDLAFFCNDDSGKADFGGIYIGDGMMIYCPMPGQSVKETDITGEYWQGAFVTGVRLS